MDVGANIGLMTIFVSKYNPILNVKFSEIRENVHDSGS
ncbi:MAG: hypothetical protein RI883_1374 [Bacteroidota bacterium]